MTLRKLQRDCAHKRSEYLLARAVHTTVTQIEIPDTAALQDELRNAMLAYYSAHGALHAKLRERAERPGRLH